MPLQKQEISIVFTEGVDTKTDDKIATKPSVLENAVIGQKSTTKKRNGFEELDNTLFDSGEMLLVNKNALALISPDKFAVRYDALASGWRQDASLYNASTINTTYTDVNIPLENSFPAGLQIVSGQQDDIIAFNTITDSLSGTLIYNNGFFRRSREDGSAIYQSVNDNVTLSASSSGHVVGLLTKAYWILFEGTSVFATDVSLPIFPYSTTTLSTDASGTNSGVAINVNDLIFTLYVNNSGKLTIKSYDQNLVLQNSFVHTAEVDPIVGSFAIAYNISTGLYGVFYQVSNGASLIAKSLYLTSSLVQSGTLQSITKLNQIGSSRFKMTAIYSADAGGIFVAYDSSEGVVRASSSASSFVEASTFPGSIIVSDYFNLNGIPHVVIDTFLLFSETFTGLTFNSVYRSSLIDYNGNYCAQISLDHISYPLITLGRLKGATLPISTGQGGFALTEITSSNFQNSSPQEINGSTVVFNSGGLAFDGYAYHELGFVGSAVGSEPMASVGAGNIAAGTYTYSLVLKYTDFNGNVYLSSPYSTSTMSIVLETPKNVSFDIFTTMPSKRYSGVTVEVYRRSLIDTIFRKVGSVPVDLFSSSSMSFTDSLATNSSNETLYTTGGILENDPPPVANIFCAHQDRVFCVDEENPVAVYFSKKTQPGEGIHFSQSLFFIASVGGRITGLGSLDDKLIIFKESSIFAVFGDGPNSLGVGSFSEPRNIIQDIGCRDVRSIVATPEGLMFMSKKGIYLLSRSMQITYIGADVELYNAQEITSGVLMADINQVRFTTRGDVTLVYSYLYQQWSWFTNYESQHAIVWQNSFAHLLSDGTVLVENGDYSDVTTPITQKIASGWIKLNGVQNLQRITRVSFIGNWKSTHKVLAKIYYDYEEYAWEEVTITPRPSGYNVTSKPAISTIYTGGNTGVYEYEIQLSRQKCMAFKIEISDFDHSGESFSITGMSLIAGLKKGLNKIASNKKF